MSTTAFLTLTTKLPDYTNELIAAQEQIEKLKEELSIIKTNKSITDTIHENLFERVMRVLDYVGRLSEPSFAIEDELERMYFINYPHSPELARKLWQDHYETIHHPFDLLKNRSFRLIEELDAEFHIIHKRHPKNWKP